MRNGCVTLEGIGVERGEKKKSIHLSSLVLSNSYNEYSCNYHLVAALTSELIQ